MKFRLRVWKIVVIGGVAFIVVYFFLPNATSQNADYSFVGASSVGFILLGVHLNRPKNRRAWYYIAAAGAFFTLGDDAYTVYTNVFHVAVPFPSYADALYLSGYPCLFAGALSLTRSPTVFSRREDTADATIVALGVLAISWHFLMNSYVSDPTLTTFGLFVNLAYPIMDIALVFIVFRTLLFRDSTNPVHRLLAAALSVMLVADFTYDVMVLHGSYTSGNAVDGLFLLEYVLIAAAALHPSNADSTRKVIDDNPVQVTSSSQDRLRMPILILAGSISPAILVVATSLDVRVNVIALGLICLIVFAIIFLRLTWLIQRLGAQSFRLIENIRKLEISQLQREELEGDLRHQALHDPLTGLANRTLFEDRLLHAQERLARSGGKAAVLLLDLDNFKGVNDAYGHLVGDKLLISIARRLETVTRSSDTLCRLGGDEFLYLAESMESESEIQEIAPRLLGALLEPIFIQSLRLELHGSIGATMCDATNKDGRNCVQEADIALYEAKRERRGHFVIFSPSMQESALSRFTLVQELRDALRVGDISMYFQPIVKLSTNEAVGFEALMRWKHPQRGWIPPGVFIPLAEESDLIFALGTFALREAIVAASSWQRVGHDEALPYVSVNFSAHQFHLPDIVAKIEDALRVSALDPSRLIVEITESAALDDIDETVKVVRDLAELGIGIVLDDFGTGYSSLSYLVLLHPNIIKIDRSFVSSTLEGTQNAALLEEIITLGQRLNITVLAEGIETPEQLARLRQLGCELGQGFLFSPAVPANEVPSIFSFPVGRTDGTNRQNETSSL